MKKQKAVKDMTLVELLNDIETLVTEDGEFTDQDRYDEETEVIMNFWPFCDIRELQDRVFELEKTVKKLKRHGHIGDGTMVVGID